MDISAQIESLLFYKGDLVDKEELGRILDVSYEEVEQGIRTLQETLRGRGIRLMESAGKVELRTAPEMAACIETLRKNELNKDLGKAGLETLSILLYKHPISRAEIDYIRGVQSTAILRNLSLRGLIERIPNPKDQRGYLYQPTTELLGYLGIEHAKHLPEYEAVQKELEAFQENTDNTHHE